MSNNPLLSLSKAFITFRTCYYVGGYKLLVLNNGKTRFIIDAFLNYEMDDKTNEPKSYGDDEMDSIRYYLNERPEWENPNKLKPPPYIIPDEASDILMELIRKSKSIGLPEEQYFSKPHRRAW